MRILGVDPGLATIGLGLIEAQSGFRVQALDWLTITTQPRLPLHERLEEIRLDFSQFLGDCKPDLVVVERIFFAVNEQSAIDVAHARGVLLSCIAKQSLPMLEPTPLQMKRAIAGDGQADKRHIQDMLKHLLKLSVIPSPVDAADALALAIYGAMHRPKDSYESDESKESKDKTKQIVGMYQ